MFTKEIRETAEKAQTQLNPHFACRNYFTHAFQVTYYLQLHTYMENLSCLSEKILCTYIIVDCVTNIH